jgi:hypothetical protein
MGKLEARPTFSASTSRLFFVSSRRQLTNSRSFGCCPERNLEISRDEQRFEARPDKGRAENASS